jgi:hypothetical protein
MVYVCVFAYIYAETFTFFAPLFDFDVVKGRFEQYVSIYHKLRIEFL